MNEKEKQEFVKALNDLYLMSSNPFGITEIELVEDDFLYVHNKEGYWVVSVWGDNTHGILKDFVKFLESKDDYSYKLGGKK